MKSSILLAIFICSLTFLSCSNKKEETAAEKYLRPATMEFTSQDTSQINSLVNQYISCIKAKDFQGASAMLYKIKNDTIRPLTNEERQGFVMVYSNLPIYDCQVNSFKLRSDKNNQVDVMLKVKQDGNYDTGVGIMKIAVNPIVKNSKWYLTLEDKNAEGVEDIYDPSKAATH